MAGSVERVDAVNQEITLKGPDGSLETIMVSNPENLRKVVGGESYQPRLDRHNQYSRGSSARPKVDSTFYSLGLPGHVDVLRLVVNGRRVVCGCAPPRALEMQRQCVAP